MQQRKRALAVLITATLLASAASAMENDKSMVPYDRDPGAAVGAALINIVYLPVRIMTTFIGAEFAGIVGLFTGGNVRAANDTFDLVNGSQVITPKMLDGKEQFHWNAYD
ncbi:MAG: hypothetical protein ABI629_19860 [bacterium]